jgi:hypothetical protein
MAHYMLSTHEYRQSVQDGANPMRIGDKVRFRVSDVFLPSADALLEAPPSEGELDGTIVDFSDSGQRARVFALVDVVRTQTVVVPVEKLEKVLQSGPDRGS